jgi:hypothetical protein
LGQLPDCRAKNLDPGTPYKDRVLGGILHKVTLRGLTIGFILRRNRPSPPPFIWQLIVIGLIAHTCIEATVRFAA